jgi:predicted negative regulator of RcsB-dependent stress response
MSKKEKNLAHAQVDTHDELEVLQEWWQKHGNLVTTIMVIVLAVVLAFNLYEKYRASAEGKASLAYSQARSAESLEEVVATHKSSAYAPLAQLQIGSEYYHRQDYELAEGAYKKFLAEYPRHELAPIAIVGLAHVAEARSFLAEAEEQFKSFAQSYPAHYLTQVALLGQARCLAMLDRRDEARAILDRMMADRAGTPWSKQADDLLAALPRLTAVDPASTTSFDDALKAFETTLSPELGGVTGEPLTVTVAPAEGEASAEPAEDSESAAAATEDAAAPEPAAAE